MAVELGHLVCGLRRRAQRTCPQHRTDRIDLGRGRLLRGFLHTDVRFHGVGSGCVAIDAVDGRGKGPVMNLLFEKILRNSSQSVVVKESLDRRKICAVAAVVGNCQASEPTQQSLTWRSGFMFPDSLGCGNIRDLVSMPEQITTKTRSIRGRRERWN